MPDRPTNLEAVRARHAQERLMLAAVDSYQTYLISRSSGVESAIRPAWQCWQIAQRRYLTTCNSSKWAAPGSAESLGAAQEESRP